MTKRIFVTIIMTLAAVFAVNVVAASDNDRLWDSANTAYMNGDWAGAIAIYDSIEQSGMVSAKLYYNMGGAHFKNGSIGKAVLYYNKSLRLNPSDEDAAYNLAVVNGFVRDQIEVVPEFFASRWMRAVRLSLSSNGWAFVSLVALLLMLGAVLLYLLPLGLRYRKTGFGLGVVFGVVMLMAMNFAAEGRREALHSKDAVVMLSAAPVKSSPNNSSKDIFVIHEGTRVMVLDRLGEWCQVSIADGNKGWLPASSIEMID